MGDQVLRGVGNRDETGLTSPEFLAALERHKRQLLHDRNDSNALTELARLVIDQRRSTGIPYGTVIYADVVRSSRLAALLSVEDADGYMRVLDPVIKAIRDVIHRHNGTVEVYAGDGLLGTFNCHSPLSEHEYQAALAARSVIETVEGFDMAQLDMDPGPLKIRVGLSSGPIIYPQLLGLTENIAGKLAQVALPGEILASRLTFDRVRDYFKCKLWTAESGTGASPALEEVLEIFLLTRGFPLSIHSLGQPTGLEPRTGSRISTQTSGFVGRQSQLADLVTAWEDVGGLQNRAALVSGVAGIGKSRLAQEFWDVISERDRAALPVIGRCSPDYRNSTFHVVKDLFRNYLGIGSREAHGLSDDRLRLLEDVLGQDAAETIPFIADLVDESSESRFDLADLTPEQKLERTMRAVLTWIRAIGRARPTLVVIEDLHWLDPVSEQLLDRIVDEIHSLPVFLLMTHRPEASSRDKEGFSTRWKNRVKSVSLGVLDPEESRLLLLQSAGGTTLGQQNVQAVVDRSSGVPLYLEEFGQHVAELGQLPSANWTPPPLNRWLAARLDQLENDAGRLAALASVFGRSFSRKVLVDLAREVPDGEPEHVSRRISVLLGSGIFQHRETASNEVLTFKHMLIRNAAYASIQTKRKRAIHSALARLLETNHPEVVRSEPAVLARHYEAAGNLDSAIDYLRSAGELAEERSGFPEAVSHMQKAISLLPGGRRATRAEGRSPDACLEVDLQSALGRYMIAARSYADKNVRRAYDRALSLHDQCGDDARQFKALIGKASFLLIRGNVVASSRECTSAVSLPSIQHGSLQSVTARAWQGTADFYLGNLNMARENLEQVCRDYRSLDIDHHDVASGLDPAVLAQSHLLWLYCMIGDVNRAKLIRRQMIRLANRLGSAMSLCHALNFSAVSGVLLGDFQSAFARASVLIDIASESNLPHYRAYGMITAGRSVAVLIDRHVGREQIELGLTDRMRSGAGLAIAFHNGLLAQTLLELGEIEAAARRLDAAREGLDQNNEEWWRPEIERLHGRCLAASGRQDAARASLERSAAMASEKSMHLLAGRSLYDLANLERRQGMSYSGIDRYREFLSEFPQLADLVSTGHDDFAGNEG